MQHADFRKVIKEEYVYIAETDHVMLRPLPNLATEAVPAAFNFGYMVAWGQAKIVDKFVPGLGGKTDPVGPSPVIIHVAQLEKMVQPWYDYTKKICNDREAVQALGWVREMWGWCLAAGSLGIKHRVLESFQYEGGSIGNRERPLLWPVAPTPVSPDRPDMPYYIFHYTYGIEYSLEGLPMELQVGEWSLDKRHYMGAHPPQRLLAPPACAHDRAWVLSGVINNASAALAQRWPGGPSNLDRFNRVELRHHPLREHEVAGRLLGTGPWLLSGGSAAGGSAYRLEKLWVLANGWLVSSKGHGRWGLLERRGGGGGGASRPLADFESGVVVLKICAKTIVVRLQRDKGEWTLWEAASGGGGGSQVATLEQSADVLARWDAPVVRPSDPLEERVEGSGPYRGSHAGQVVLLRAGVLHATGGAYNAHTRWRALGGTKRQAVVLGGPTDVEMDVAVHGGGAASARLPWRPAPGSKAVVADFTDCWVLRFPGADDGPLGRALGSLIGGASSSREPASEPPPPKYGSGVSARQAEWILQPVASLCQDVCAGLTLRKLTAADRAASALARSVEGCCGWSWAGFGGLKFEPNGRLVTPWGHGVWGAPPEMQRGSSGALLAEFAGHKHLLRVQLDAARNAAGRRMQSTRCADNDQSPIVLTDGNPYPQPK